MEEAVHFMAAGDLGRQGLTVLSKVPGDLGRLQPNDLKKNPTLDLIHPRGLSASQHHQTKEQAFDIQLMGDTTDSNTRKGHSKRSGSTGAFNTGALTFPLYFSIFSPFNRADIIFQCFIS